MESFLVHQTLVSTEHDTDMEEKVLCQGVKEGAYDIRVVLDLVKAGFGIIGVDNKVIVWLLNA